VEVDDLIANGMLGLLDAMRKFDATKRVEFKSYAQHRIRCAILDGLRGVDPVPRDLRRKKKRVQQLYRELEGKLGRSVQDEDMAGALGMNLPQWHRALNTIENVGSDCTGRSLTAGPTSKSVNQQTEPELLVDESADPFEQWYRGEQREILGRALSCLGEREQQVIILYYQHEVTMKQIADRLEVDESRVSQLHSAALARLRTSVNSLLNPRNAISILGQ
jgi:RNA polymerase sigma factor for flagellar operon FliA